MQETLTLTKSVHIFYLEEIVEKQLTEEGNIGRTLKALEIHSDRNNETERGF